ncbi:MAG TPA: hypothetical protein VKZ82_28400 [Nonomuraea sp.]|nr:hypothetical protein [Nonomuraea sp.]
MKKDPAEPGPSTEVLFDQILALQGIARNYTTICGGVNTFDPRDGVVADELADI